MRHAGGGKRRSARQPAESTSASSAPAHALSSRQCQSRHLSSSSTSSESGSSMPMDSVTSCHQHTGTIGAHVHV